MKITSIYTTSLVALLVFSSAASAQSVKIPAADRALTGSPANQFSIGAEDGEDWELLSRVSGVAFDKSDNLYVLDAGNSRVLVFNAQGKFVRKIGKKGGGPGELMTPVGLALTSDGYIAVTDLGRPGVSLFKTDGAFVKNLMMGDSLGFPTPGSGTLAYPGGGVVVRSNPLRVGGGALRVGDRIQGPPSAAPTGPRKSPFTLLTADGGSRKVYELTLPSLTPKVQNSGGSGGQQVMVRIAQPAFTPPILWSVLPDGSIAIADEDDYRVKISKNGKLLRTIERAFPTRKVTERDKNAAREQRRKQMKGGIGAIAMTTRVGPGGNSSSSVSTGGGMPRISDADIEQSIKEMTFLETVPNLQRMIVDPKGRFWIQRQGREFGQDGPIDIIDASGKYVGTFTGKLPDAFSATGRAAYITRDDMDVEKVEVKRLPAW